MEMELRLSNDSPLLPSVRAFVRSTLNELGLPDTTVSGLEQLVDEVIAHTIEHAYPHGEDGAVIVGSVGNGSRHGALFKDVLSYTCMQLEYL